MKTIVRCSFGLSVLILLSVANAGEYEFLKLLKVGQCVEPNVSVNRVSLYLEAKELCEKPDGRRDFYKISKIGPDYLILIEQPYRFGQEDYQGKQILYTAQSIGAIYNTKLLSDK